MTDADQPDIDPMYLPSDVKKIQLVDDDRQAKFRAIASEPGGLAYLGRHDVVRARDGRFYFVSSKNSGISIVRIIHD